MGNEFDDQDIEDILNESNQPKEKVDGKAKGNRTELNLCKFLTKHFKDEFSRALGSGSRWSQVGNLPEHAKKTLCGDICVPEKFRFVIESKGGYEGDLNLTNVLDNEGIPRLNEFIQQTVKDAEYSGRKPIILWKRNRKQWITIIRYSDIKQYLQYFKYFVQYDEWMLVNFQQLLEVTPREFWFHD